MGPDEDWVRIHTFVTYGGGSYSELSSRDKNKYTWVVGASVRMLEIRFRQAQLGVLSEEDLTIGGGASNEAWFRAPHFIEWWKSGDRSRAWPPDFLEFFETQVLEIR